MVQVLALAVSGQPLLWLTTEQAILAQVTGKILYGWGEENLVFLGGTRADGRRSRVEVAPIVVLAGADMARFAATVLPLTNPYLFGRDRYTCAYCGGVFPRQALSRDHVIPRVQGGLDVWGNVLTACRPCNGRKGGRRPEEAGMLPLFVPYAPVQAEGLLLQGRRILASQMAFLKARIPRTSRVH